jgi:hypothetical protein
MATVCASGFRRRRLAGIQCSQTVYRKNGSFHKTAKVVNSLQVSTRGYHEMKV